MSFLSKLVSSHLQSVIIPTEHKPNLLPGTEIRYIMSPNPKIYLQSNSGLLSGLIKGAGEQ